MAGIMGKWPSKRGRIAEIMPSDGRKGDRVPLAVGREYHFHEFGCHLGISVRLESITLWSSRS